MKTTLSYLLLWIIGFAFAYLISVFFTWSWNPGKWEGFQLTCTIIAGILVNTLLVMIFKYTKEQSK